jgi:hypothetical protein
MRCVLVADAGMAGISFGKMDAKGSAGRRSSAMAAFSPI